ncbi:hypothetical protein SAMD00019534_086790 [Acytostelium subglobosum LB1]|uniref:hypothetical protein n=1 Tax=Acytostelium subglobosum LB1 TaxID=1410327 RepID=UPI0006451A9B|nr:hypothetical protein SAMD00019534_086790 [Acytostelium subglobosum LB1]GAM25504.1 hypothetical protein SAMD00019534_086790 [Acytostelium subglobosum LB1]|eukprot:XP_012751490.1 hypothetical protein SAMD00019534_086790 [Acytostelium subglobosum LB1]
MANDDDDNWDDEFGFDNNSNDHPTIHLSLQRKLTIGNLSKKFLPVSPALSSATTTTSRGVGGPATTISSSPKSGSSDFGFDDGDVEDDDDWDAVVNPVASSGRTATSGVSSTSIPKPKTQQDDDDDWDADFATSIKSPLSAATLQPQMKILGIRADPTVKTEWDDDFVFNDSSESEQSSSTGIPASMPSITASGLGKPGNNINISISMTGKPNITSSTSIHHHHNTSSGSMSGSKSIPFGSRTTSTLDAKLLATVSELISCINFGPGHVELNESHQTIDVKTPPLNELKVLSETEMKKRLDAQNVVIDRATGGVGVAKVDLSKMYFDLGLIYSSNQQTMAASAQFTTANRILQEHKDDFDAAPLDDTQTLYELNLYYQLGLAYKAMANIFNTTEYLKKALELCIARCDLAAMQQKINVELGMCYLATETPIYAARHFESAIRAILFTPCTQQHLHNKDCKQVDLKKTVAGEASLVHSLANGCLQLAKSLKMMEEHDLAVQAAQRSFGAIHLDATAARQQHGALYNECVQLYRDTIVHLKQQQQKPIIQVQDTTKATSTQDFESDEEDWDAELGLDVEEDSRPVLQLAGQAPNVAPNKDRMPSHYKLIEGVNNQTFEIVKYPKPSYLYSMNTPDGHPFMHEEALSQWLSGLVIKHLDGADMALRVLPKKAALEELRNEFTLESTKVKNNLKKWTQMNLEFCYTLHIFDYDEPCWDSVHEFFLALRDCGGNSSPLVRPTAGRLTPTTTQTSLLRPPASPRQSSRRASMEIDERDATYHYALQMLYLAAKLWRAEEDSSFRHMCQGLKNLSASNAAHVELMAAETYSHHLHHKCSSGDSDSDNDNSDSDLEEPELRTRPEEFAGSEEEKVNPLNVFLRVYTQCALKQQQQQQADAKYKDYLEIGLKSAMVKALIDVHFHVNGISPLTTARLSDKPATSVNVDAQFVQLLDANHRMALLTKLYTELPATNFLKAKAAYALGLHAVDNSELALAEKLFFECLYIVDRCKQPVVGLPLVLSELAGNASFSYASVLLDNYKYQYAIVSFDNALLNLNIRKKRKEYLSLLSKVATLARENDDINSAIYYFKQVLNGYLESDPQSKTNEIVYICEVISSMHRELGNYKQCEEYLKVVLLILHKSTSSQSTVAAHPIGPGDPASISKNLVESPKYDNPIFFQLHMKLINLYLESYHFEKGLELLMTMRRHTLPHGKQNSLFFLLAKAYTKMEMFDECTNVLNQLDSSAEESGAQTQHAALKLGILKGAPITAFTNKSASQSGAAGGGSGGNKSDRNLNYWVLNCLNYLAANKFAEALLCIECAIEICPLSSLNARGQYFYTRGKIFQRLIQLCNATLITFPTNLRPSGEEWRDFIDSSQLTNYTSTGDLLQEGIASFKRAYNYFKSTGDDVKIQKTVSHIAELYLDRLFAPVALHHYPFDDVARLSIFNLSIFMQRDSEQQQQDDKHKRGKAKAAAEADTAAVKPASGDFYITLDMIENPSTVAMDVNINTCNILQLLRTYMNMAELRFLQGDRDLAISYWTEARNLFYTLFCDGPHFIGKSAPLHFLKKVFESCKRMIRFLFAFDQDFINKNLMLVDSYLSLEIDIAQARKRPINPNRPISYDANPMIGKIYIPYLGKSLTLGRNIKRKTEMTAAISMDFSVHTLSIPKQPFCERTRPEERPVKTGDDVGEKLWGALHYIKNEIRKYSIGKINQDDLSTRCKVTIKHILAIHQAYKNHLVISQSAPAATPSSPGSPNIPMLQSSNSLASLFRQQQASGNSSSSGNASPKITQSQSPSHEALMGRTRTPSNASSTTTTAVFGANRRDLSTKYEELSFTTAQAKINASLQKLVYSLQVDNYFIHYLPHSGRKRLNRIGGMEELDTMQPCTNMVYLDIMLLSNPKEKVSFMVSPQITLDKVLYTLCNRPYWAVDGAQAADPKKKGFLGSFSRNTHNALKSAPRFIEKTTNFHNELVGFLNSIIGPPTAIETVDGAGSEVHHQHTNTQPILPSGGATYDKVAAAAAAAQSEPHNRSYSVGASQGRKVYTKDQLSLISLAKRMTRGGPAHAKGYMSFDQLNVPLSKVFSQREMNECTERNALQLSLFVNSGEEKKSCSSRALDSPLTTSSEDVNDQAIAFKPDTLTSLLSLLSLTSSKEVTQEDIDRKKIVNDLRRSVFGSLFEILPTEKSDTEAHKSQAAATAAANAKKTRSFVFFGNSKTSEATMSAATLPATNISTSPMIFICSKSLQVFPWELIIQDFMVRYLTLYDLMKTSCVDVSDPENQENGIIPTFVSCCNSSIDKTHYIDNQRKDRLLKSIFYNLYTTINTPSGRLPNDNQPFLSPLIKLGVKPSVVKKKYKYLDFFDLSTSKISGIVNFLESFDDSIHFPVFIFTYHDIVDLSQLPLFILRSKPICNVLFIPYCKQKEIMSRLCKIYDVHLKQNVKNATPSTRKERYQFLISAVQNLKEEFQVPIAIFNPTFFVNK